MDVGANHGVGQDLVDRVEPEEREDHALEAVLLDDPDGDLSERVQQLLGDLAVLRVVGDELPHEASRETGVEDQLHDFTHRQGVVDHQPVDDGVRDGQVVHLTERARIRTAVEEKNFELVHDFHLGIPLSAGHILQVWREL